VESDRMAALRARVRARQTSAAGLRESGAAVAAMAA
jgi:mevalonate pyrophosphate decarboxylase